MAEPSLYEAVLGSEFAGLAPVLRRFHASGSDGRANGRLRVARGTGLARFAGWCIGAPEAGDAILVEMIVVVEAGCERWTRWFAGSPMVTRQWREGDRLVEAFGPSALSFELELADGAMVFVQRGCRVLGIPLPRFLAPRVRARAGPSTNPRGWQIDVEIAHPWIGTIVGYSGTMEIVEIVEIVD
jgi:hypothetical protein